MTKIGTKGKGRLGVHEESWSETWETGELEKKPKVPILSMTDINLPAPGFEFPTAVVVFH